MGVQYDRAITLALDGQTIVQQAGNPDDALRVRFKIKTRTTQSPNTAQVIITNLSNSTSMSLMSIAQNHKSLTLSAGYIDNVGLIYMGDCYAGINGRESPTDKILQIFARDGGQAYDYGVISKCLAAGSTPKDHFDAFAQALAPFGITPGFTPDTLTSLKYPRGVAFAGMVKDYLRTLADSNQCTWSIQNNILQMVPVSGTVPGNPYVLNSNTGLIGMPTQTFGGIMARCLINPSINLVSGGKVQIDQSLIQGATPDLSNTADATNALLPPIATDGIYKILQIEVSGDTRGNEWYQDLTCFALNTGASLIPTELGINNTDTPGVQN